MNSGWQEVFDRLTVETCVRSGLALQAGLLKSKTPLALFARRTGISQTELGRNLQGRRNLTLRTMTRLLAACGYELHFRIVPIIDTDHTGHTTTPISSDSPIS